MDSDPWSLNLPNGELDLRTVCDWDRPVDAISDEIAASKAHWLRPTDRGKLPTKCAGVDFEPLAECPA